MDKKTEREKMFERLAIEEMKRKEDSEECFLAIREYTEAVKKEHGGKAGACEDRPEAISREEAEEGHKESLQAVKDRLGEAKRNIEAAADSLDKLGSMLFVIGHGISENPGGGYPCHEKLAEAFFGLADYAYMIGEKLAN